MTHEYLMHGTVETAEIQESARSEVLDSELAELQGALARALQGGKVAVPVRGGWMMEADASYPAGCLFVRLHAPGVDPEAACTVSFSARFATGKPPVVWTSRAGVRHAPDPVGAANGALGLELGLVWAWLPLIQGWIRRGTGHPMT